jgi:hypothetical protein
MTPLLWKIFTMDALMALCVLGYYAFLTRPPRRRRTRAFAFSRRD